MCAEELVHTRYQASYEVYALLAGFRGEDVLAFDYIVSLTLRHHLGYPKVL